MKKLLAVVLCFTLVVLLTGCGKAITQTEARNLALKDAKLTEKEVTFTAEKQDDDSYEFTFHTEDTSYQYEIDKSGKISEKETSIYQNKTDSLQTNEKQSPTLSKEEALAKAYEFFKVTSETATNIQVKQEIENGRAVYDIEFDSDLKEYSCEIDMQTGEVVSNDVDNR